MSWVNKLKSTLLIVNQWTGDFSVILNVYLFQQQGGNGESNGRGNKNTSRIRDLIQEGTLSITWTNWKEQGTPTWCGEMSKSKKWPIKMQQHLQNYNSTNVQSTKITTRGAPGQMIRITGHQPTKSPNLSH